MRTLILLFILVIFSTNIASSATKLDFRTVDELTYRYYNEQKWDSVIGLGKKALRQNIDYYYLRVRMGISSFEIQAYFPAITHLKKAREFNSGDPVITDYLYRSYLYSNRQEEAQLLKASMPKDTREIPDPNNRFVEQIHFEGGYTLSSDRSPDNLSDLMGKDSIYGEQDLYGNNLYNNLSLKFRISNRIGFSLAYNYLNFNKTKYIQYGRNEAQLDTITDNPFSKDYFYSYPWKVHDTSFRYNVKQHEGYIGASFLCPFGIRATPSIHLIHVSYSKVNPGYRIDSISDTAYYSKADSSYQMFKYPSVEYFFNEKDTSFNNWVVFLGLSKDLGRFNTGLYGSWSNLNNKKQVQVGASLTWYPLGNLNLYETTRITGVFQNKDNRLLLAQIIGGKITPWMWLEGNFYWGDYTNANIYYGSVVYNNSDIIDYRAGVNLVFNVGKHMQLSLIYQYFRKESQQLYYIKTTDPVTHEINEVPQIKNNPYNTNTIIGGITWKL